MASVDVTIRGAGVFGLCIAWACLQRGARVRVIDPDGPGAGASGGIVGALAPHVPENWNAKKAFQLDSLLMADAWWRSVAQAGGHCPGYARSGRIQPLADAAARALAEARAVEADTLWQGRADWRVVTDPGAFAPPSPTGTWVHDTLSARIHPAQSCSALGAALRARGAEIASEGRDEGAVVWATGWRGLLALSEALGRSVGTGIKGQAVLLEYAAMDAPQVFVEGLHIVPHADGTVAIGSTTEREFTAPDQTDDQCDALLARAVDALPQLASAPVVARWAGVRPRARSRAPMLGPYPGRPGHFIANGGFKIGFGMAPKVAQVMADLILEGQDSIPQGFRVEDNL